MSQTDTKTILEWALEYHKRGWCVIPIRTGTKKPAVSWKKYQTELPSENQIKKWFGNGKYISLAVVCGAVSDGLTVLDLDSEERCQWWSKEHSGLAGTLPTSKTRKGQHICFHSVPFRKQNGDDVDLLCEGAYVVLPPSPNKQWLIPLNGELPLLNPFEWGLEQFGIKKPIRKHFTDGKDGSESKEGIDGNEGKEGNDGKKGVSKLVVSVKFDSLSEETQRAIKEAIDKTLPKAYGQRYRLIFLFCRYLKKIDEIKNKSSEELMNICNMWHEKALPNIEHKSLVMTQERFKNSWEDAKYPVGEGKSLEIAKEEAFNSTMLMPELEEFKGEKVIEKIIRLSFSLQKLAGPDDEWFIPTNKAQELFGISHSWLAIMLKMLCDKKITKKTKDHTNFKCTRYKFIGPSISSLLN